MRVCGGVVSLETKKTVSLRARLYDTALSFKLTVWVKMAAKEAELLPRKNQAPRYAFRTSALVSSAWPESSSTTLPVSST